MFLRLDLTSKVKQICDIVAKIHFQVGVKYGWLQRERLLTS